MFETSFIRLIHVFTLEFLARVSQSNLTAITHCLGLLLGYLSVGDNHEILVTSKELVDAAATASLRLPDQPAGIPSVSGQLEDTRQQYVRGFPHNTFFSPSCINTYLHD
jgi:hypothetical protein